MVCGILLSYCRALEKRPGRINPIPHIGTNHTSGLKLANSFEKLQALDEFIKVTRQQTVWNKEYKSAAQNFVRTVENPRFIRDFSQDSSLAASVKKLFETAQRQESARNNQLSSAKSLIRAKAKNKRTGKHRLGLNNFYAKIDRNLLLGALYQDPLPFEKTLFATEGVRNYLKLRKTHWIKTGGSERSFVPLTQLILAESSASARGLLNQAVKNGFPALWRKAGEQYRKLASDTEFQKFKIDQWLSEELRKVDYRNMSPDLKNQIINYTKGFSMNKNDCYLKKQERPPF